MKRIGVTSPDSFLGRHLRRFLASRFEEVELILLSTDLENLSECDAIVHLSATTPRDIQDEEGLIAANVAHARALTDACDMLGIAPHIVFASSTQVRRDTSYGRAKKAAAACLETWAVAHGTSVTTLIVPHEYGEGGRPFDGSVVATFCYQLARGEASDVSDGSVSLLYAQEIVRTMYEALQDKKGGERELGGMDMSVADLYALLSSLYTEYVNDIVPLLPTKLHASLFATLRYHLWEAGFYPRAIAPRSDERGTLFEVAKERTGGATFVSTTKPGMTRGNHYHSRKLERFCVVAGTATIRLRDILDDTVLSYEVSGDTPSFIDMPSFVTHSLENTSTADVTTAFWISEILDRKDPDTYPLAV